MQGELHVKWKPDVFLRILNNNLRLCAGSVPLCVIEHWIFQILQWQNISRITNVFTDHAEREQLQPDLPRRHLQRAAEKRWISLVKVCQLAEKTGDDELWWLLLHLLNPFHFFYSDLQWTPRSFCRKRPPTSLLQDSYCNTFSVSLLLIRSVVCSNNRASFSKSG